jgi:hypothetical protein
MLNFIRKHIWLILIIFLLALFPQSLTDQAKLNMRVIITGIGVDYEEDKYAVTAQVVLPTASASSTGINAQIKYITAEGDTIADSVQQISYKIGKVAEPSHIEFIVVGDGMKQFNIASSLDYFFRNFKLKNGVMLLSCIGTAKDAISKTGNLELSIALDLQKIYLANESSLNAVAKSYVEFVSDSNSVSGASVLDTLQISVEGEDDASGSSSGGSGDSSESGGGSGGSSSSGGSGGSSSGSSGGSSGSGSGSSSQGIIDTFSPLLLYKNGKYFGEITDENQIEGYYFLRKRAMMGNIQLQNFTYGDAVEANINLRIDQMHRKFSIDYSSGKPVETIDIKISEVKIDEIAPKYGNSTSLYADLDKGMQDAIIAAAKEQIEGNINSLFETCKAQNFDIFRTADLASQLSPKKWQQFLSNLADPSEYMQDVTAVVNVTFDKIS